MYVDNLIITSYSVVLIQRFIHNLHQFFALKDLGDLSFFHGIQIKSNSTGLTLSQEGYIRYILNKIGMDAASLISTPTNCRSGITLVVQPFSDPRLYRQVIGSLQYATITRPDISYIVNRAPNTCILSPLFTSKLLKEYYTTSMGRLVTVYTSHLLQKHLF